MTAIALTIAGSDSGGGAGIQADLKSFSALGVYGASAITAITAQNTRAVTAVQALSPQMVKAQIETVFADLDVKAVKIGMLADAAVIRAVTEALSGWRGPVVLDPVMIAKSGDALLEEEAVSALATELLPLATILTPNLPEAGRLLGLPAARDEGEVRAQGEALRGFGPRWVLMKGGHAQGEICEDLLIGPETLRLTAPRLPTRNTHGTGCSLSSAIAAGLALGLSPPEAVTRAHGWLQGALAAADEFKIGSGHGPVHHFHELWRRA